MNIINLHDKNLYYIGGVVRDELLGKESFDIDLTYEGDAVEFAKNINGVQIKQINKDFGTVRILYDGKEIDIASTRNEIYPHKGHLPEVFDIGCSLRDDVLRRDFTINALAKSTMTGEIKDFTGGLKSDFYLLGEMLHGDYNRLMNDAMLHSATNYECYKGLYSSFNSMNMFEIIHSLLRQFGPENWTLYKEKHLLSFVDNHDVSRIASTLSRPEHLKLIYTLMFGMPGIPTIYYGSEWGEKADKSQGDPALRPCFEKPQWNELTDTVSSLCKARNGSKALSYGGFTSLLLTNRQCIFERETDGDRIIVVINADENNFHADFNARAGKGKDMIAGLDIDFGGGLDIPPYTGYLIQV